MMDGIWEDSAWSPRSRGRIHSGRRILAPILHGPIPGLRWVMRPIALLVL